MFVPFFVYFCTCFLFQSRLVHFFFISSLGIGYIAQCPEHLNRVISLHTRISNNFNQYAKKANETGKLYEEDIAEIKKMNNEQTELLKKALEVVIHLYEEDSKKRK